jgi:hypothetical protein
MNMHTLKDLVTVLAEEVRVAEALLHNLAAQREAVLSWDSVTLLEKVEEREVAIRKLGALEERRQEILAYLPGACEGTRPSCTVLLAQLPPRPEVAVLDQLRRRALEVYGRLRAEEKRFVALMENLLGHVREALAPLAHPPLHLYGKMGDSRPLHPASGLIEGKA